MLFKFLKNPKFYLIFITLLTSIAIFYFYIFNYYTDQSKASNSDVYLLFFPNKVMVNSGDTISIDVFLNSANKRVSAAKITFFYTNNLKFLNANKLSNNCNKNQGNKFSIFNKVFYNNKDIKVYNNKKGYLVSVIRVSALNKDKLPNKSFCFTTLRFKVMNNNDAFIQFFNIDDKNYTQIVGPDSNSNYKTKLTSKFSVSLIKIKKEKLKK